MKRKLFYTLLALVVVACFVVPAFQIIVVPQRGKITYQGAIRQLTFALMTYKEDYKIMPQKLMDVIYEYKDELIKPENWTPDHKLETFLKYKYYKDAVDGQPVIEFETDKYIYKGYLGGEVITEVKKEG